MMQRDDVIPALLDISAKVSEAGVPLDAGVFTIIYKEIRFKHVLDLDFPMY